MRHPNFRSKEEKQTEDTEKCVLCGEDTNVPKTENIDNRAFYVEGAGQLCESCYNKVYGPRMTNP
jgi:hypothetical protein